MQCTSTTVEDRKGCQLALLASIAYDRTRTDTSVSRARKTDVYRSHSVHFGLWSDRD